MSKDNHFLFRRFGQIIAKPGWLVLRSNKGRSPETAPRPGHEETPVVNRERSTGVGSWLFPMSPVGWRGAKPREWPGKYVSDRLYDVRDPERFPPVLPYESANDTAFIRKTGMSSKN